MIFERRRLLQLGLAASASSLAGLPAEALARTRHHAAAHRSESHHSEGRHTSGHKGEHRIAREHHRAEPWRRASEAPHPAQLAQGSLGLGAGPRHVRLDNLHTGEKLEAVYWDNGQYVPDALHAVNHVLRDFRTGDVHPMDPQLLDLLVALTAKVETKAPVSVISGYRSPRTNALLRAEGGAETGVAKKSLHLQGQAIDLRLADVSLGHLHNAALALGRGGVGYYPVSDFVHVDVGAVRQWGGV